MTVLRTPIKFITSQEAARLSEWKWDGIVIDPPPLKQTIIPGKVAGTYLLINKKFEDRVVIPPSESVMVTRSGFVNGAFLSCLNIYLCFFLLYTAAPATKLTRVTY